MERGITITMTAVRRYDLIKRTLESFYTNLFRDYPTSLIVNIDPVGPPLPLDEAFYDLFLEYTPDIIVSFPPRAHFGKAFQRVWSLATKTKYVFNLEDDWDCLRQVDLQKMIALMEADPELAILRLPCNKAADTYKSWSAFYPWNGEYFQCPDDQRGLMGFCGHPSLIRSGFVQQVAQNLNPYKNPEKQIKGHLQWAKELLQRHKFGVFSYPGQEAVIADTGRAWRGANGWLKVGTEAFFTNWEQVRNS